MTDDLVGRDAELAVLLGLLEGEAGQVAVVAGDPGLGKTRLLGELRRHAERRRLQVVAARSAVAEREMPYALLRSALGPLLAARPQLWEAVPAELAVVLAEAGRDADTRWTRHRLSEAVRRLLAAAGGAGLVLCLDDVHWADLASVEVLSYLLRAPASPPLLLALSYRPRQLPAQLRGALEEVPWRSVVSLGPLSPDSVAALVGPGQTEVHVAAAGNPQYLLALACRAGHDDRGCGLMATLRAELDALPADVRLVARAAAVCGGPLDVDLLVDVCGLPALDVISALDALADADLVRADKSARLAIRHPVVARAVYEAAGPAWRRAAHARCAAALGRAGAPLPGQAHHLRLGARPGDSAAARLLERAADEAVWRDPTAALGWYDAATRTAPAADVTTGQRLAAARARTLALAGRLAESRAALHSALEALPAGHLLRPGTVVLAARMEHLLGSHEQAVGLLQRELADGASAPELLLELATGLLALGRWEDARAEARAAVVAGRQHDRALRAAAGGMLALAEYAAGSLTAACAAAEGAALLLDSLNDAELAGRLEAAVWLGWAEMFLARYPAALRHQERALRLARHRGPVPLLVHLLVGQSNTHRAVGQLEPARCCAQEAREVALLTGSPYLLTMALCTLAGTSTWLGDLEAAQRLGQLAVDSARGRADWLSALALAALAQARLAAGRAQGCQELLVGACGGPDLLLLDRSSRPQWYAMLTRAALATGDPVAAKDWAERARVTAAALSGQLPSPRAYALLAEAEVLLFQGAAAAAAQTAEEAAQRFAAAGNILEAARGQLLVGRSHAQAGARRLALEFLAGAEEVFARCGARALRAEAVREQRRLGHRVTAPPTASVPEGTLTARERGVAELVADGRTNREIARQLFLSEKTVERHLSHLFHKLQVTSRAAVAARVSAGEGGAARG
ncbi:MAG: AAA family ATPase [Gammaproteobacteria bacterium]